MGCRESGSGRVTVPTAWSVCTIHTAGTNVAIESAGIILVRNDPRDIAKIIRLSKLTHSKMMQNLFWATGYNIAALPLAAGVLASEGILLQPAVAAIFMSASTVIVAVNAILLRRKKI